MTKPMTQNHFHNHDQRDEDAIVRQALKTLAVRGVSDHADVMGRVRRKLSQGADLDASQRWRYPLSALASLVFLVALVAIGVWMALASAGAWSLRPPTGAAVGKESPAIAEGSPMTVSADGSRVAFVDSRYRVTVWDLERERPIRALTTVTPPVRLLLDPSGVRLVIREPGRVSVWLVDQGVRAWQRELTASDDIVILSGDGNWLAISSGAAVELRDTQSGERVTTFSYRNEGVAAVHFGYDDRVIIVLTPKDRVDVKYIPVWKSKVTP